MTSVAGDQEKTQAYIEEAQKYGIKVLPPDINKSYSEYAPDGRNIRFGLASIKQVGEGVVDEIIKEREENGEFSSIYDFIKRVDVKCSNKRALEGLIKAGAFSTIEKSRKQLIENLDCSIEKKIVIYDPNDKNKLYLISLKTIFKAIVDSSF